MNPQDLPEFLTPGEVAQMFRVDPKTVTRWAKAGRLDSILTPGGQRRLFAAQVYELLRGDDQTYPAPGSEIPEQPGYVVGICGHRVAGSEWHAGFRLCERCVAGSNPTGDAR